MTEQKRYVGTRAEEEDCLSPGCPPYLKNKRKRVRQQRFLGAALIFLGSVSMLLCLLLLILPLFRVQSIEVVGVSYYSAEEIIAAAGVQTGGEAAAQNAQEIADAVLANAPYVQACRVHVFPFSVKLEIEEKKNVMYTEVDGEAITLEYLSAEGSFRVLDVCDRVPDGFRYLTLPQIASAPVGGRIVFTQEDLDISYLKTLTDSLEHYDLYESVTAMDISSKYRLSFELESGCRVKLGSLEKLDEKIAEAITLLTANPDAVEINVENLKKTTVR